MKKYYAVGITGYGSKQTAQFLGFIKAKNITEARKIGFQTYKHDWFDGTGNKQVAVVGKAGYDKYWKTIAE